MKDAEGDIIQENEAGKENYQKFLGIQKKMFDLGIVRNRGKKRNEKLEKKRNEKE